MYRVFQRKFTVYERTIVATMGGILIVASFAYVTFLVFTVAAAVDLDVAERKIDSAKSRVAEAESKYAELATSITPEMAHSLGFHDVSEPRYITSLPARGAITMRE